MKLVDPLEADRIYFEEISPAVAVVMRTMRETNPTMDYVVFAIRKGDESKITAMPHAPMLSELRARLREEPNRLLQELVDRVSKTPGSPLAHWVIISRDDGSFNMCSAMDVRTDPQGQA